MDEGFYLYKKGNLKPVLPKEEQIEYFKAFKNGDMKARDILFEHNLLLVASVINHKFYESSIDEKEELFQVGSIGLLNAIEKFDVSLGYEFSSYAIPNILGYMYNFKRNNSLVKIEQKTKKLMQEISKIPGNKNLNIQELSSLLGKNECEVKKAIYADCKIISLDDFCDENSNDDKKRTLKETIPDYYNSFEHKIEKDYLSGDIEAALESLGRENKMIVMLKIGVYSQPKSLTEISKILGIDEDKVRQSYRISIRKLKITLSNYKRKKNIKVNDEIKPLRMVKTIKN